jgi:hypothetical protein
MQINLPKIDWKSTIVKIVIVVIAFAAGILFVDRCNKPKNDVIETIQDIKGNEYQQKYLKDSVHYLEVEAKLVSNQKLLNELQDSLQKEISKNSDLITQGVIKWKERAVYSELEGVYKDSVDLLLDSAFRQHLTIDSLLFTSKNFISVPKSFSVLNDPWIRIRGTVKKTGVDIDSVITRSEPTIAFGETYSKFLGINVGRPTIKATIGNKNPHIFQEQPEVYFMQPKTSKFGATIGPSVFYDGSFKVGASVTVGYKIF